MAAARCSGAGALLCCRASPRGRWSSADVGRLGRALERLPGGRSEEEKITGDGWWPAGRGRRLPWGGNVNYGGGGDHQVSRDLPMRKKAVRVLCGFLLCPRVLVGCFTSGHQSFTDEPHSPQTTILRDGFAGSWKNPPRLQPE